MRLTGPAVARGGRSSISWLRVALVGLVGWLPFPSAAEVSDILFADVTTRAFSVIWASDEPVVDATVRVFADADGTAELTGGLTQALISQAFPPAMSQGILKIDVSGVSPDTCVYVQTETTGSVTVQSPAAPPFLEVCTAVSTTRLTPSNAPLVNDLVFHEGYAPDGATEGTGTLLLLSVPGVGAYPVSGFVGEGFASPAAVMDLTNVFDSATGTTAEVPEDAVLELTEFRGLLCPGLSSHRSVRYRRTVATNGITELVTPPTCFFADTDCDDTVGNPDAQRVLDAFGSQPGECAFNPDLDVVADQEINVLDLQSVLNRLGQSAPFSP